MKNQEAKDFLGIVHRSKLCTSIWVLLQIRYYFLSILKHFVHVTYKDKILCVTVHDVFTRCNYDGLLKGLYKPIFMC